MSLTYVPVTSNRFLAGLRAQEEALQGLSETNSGQWLASQEYDDHAASAAIESASHMLTHAHSCTL